MKLKYIPLLSVLLAGSCAFGSDKELEVSEEDCEEELEVYGEETTATPFEDEARPEGEEECSVEDEPKKEKTVVLQCDMGLRAIVTKDDKGEYELATAFIKDSKIVGVDSEKIVSFDTSHVPTCLVENYNKNTGNIDIVCAGYREDSHEVRIDIATRQRHSLCRQVFYMPYPARSIDFAYTGEGKRNIIVQAYPSRWKFWDFGKYTMEEETEFYNAIKGTNWPRVFTVFGSAGLVASAGVAAWYYFAGKKDEKAAQPQSSEQEPLIENTEE